jgi:DNA topoisomerase-1
MTAVVVVESPAKAKTIEKYLGRGHEVLASYGHVRDLPSKDGSVLPEQDFAMIYETDPQSAKQLARIAAAVKGADTLILATDPDREGEAISWHVLEALKNRRVLKDVKVVRVVFNEITKTAVTEAMKHPRDLDMALINAQQARRALDYLVGFTLSPILWRKLPGARSAGRVQSVALRLVCEREIEIEAFKAREYWTVEVDFATANGGRFAARLTQVDGRKLDKFDLADKASADAVVARLNAGSFRVADVATKPAKRHPAPPFTTSTLQQEAARKLGFGAKRTMQIAQRLYEGIDLGGETQGLITYMRTDGVSMADEAIRNARDTIGREFGHDYVPGAPRLYKTKQKNAQEAHEAIRPTDFARKPEDVARYLDDEQRKLYELVWKRALASQMESADLERTTIEITDETGKLGLRATGAVVVFPGFLKLYEEGIDDRLGDDEDSARLPKVTAQEALAREKVRPEQHFTEPPPRYSEASLVKKLEELGIGRPSTYASILSVLQERNYVRLEKNRFIPEDKGRLVTAFLTEFFEHYFAYDFTANLEDRLDDISGERIDWKSVLRDFWLPFSMLEGLNPEPKKEVVSVKEAISTLDAVIGQRSVVIDKIDAALGPHFFPDKGDGSDPRGCPACNQGRLGIKLGRNGAFIGCSRYPDCKFTKPLAVNDNEANGAGTLTADGPKVLGEDPATGLAVTLRVGPYGPYVQLGEAEGEGKAKTKPKRASLPKGTQADTVDLGLALRLLELPRTVGVHPETGKEIIAGFGRFGPFVKHDNMYASLDRDESPLDVGLNRAVDLIARKLARGAGARRGGEVLRVVGNHPADNKPIEVLNGKYGAYLRHGKINATLAKGTEPADITIEAAVAALQAKGGKAAPAAKKAAKPKAAAKKKAAAPKAKKAAPKRAAGGRA